MLARTDARYADARCLPLVVMVVDALMEVSIRHREETWGPASTAVLNAALARLVG